MKKRVIVSALIFAGLAGLMASCELLEECATCELVTIDANGIESRGTPLPFCGEEFKSRDEAPNEIVGGVETYWDC